MTKPFEQDLKQRRILLQDSSDLAGLASYLRDQLTPVSTRPLYVPDAKALLSRDGGVCVRDGSRLVFDPFEPNTHQCGTCGVTHEGVRHHRAWVWRYHLWLSERAVHAALLTALEVGDAGRWAANVLREYCVRYDSYPNIDNVLGPTRLFFSTYLESIWLIQMAMASLLLDRSGKGLSPSLHSQLENVIDESSSLVASFVEGSSNRQVWNACAVLAAGVFLRDSRRVEVGLESDWGISQLLRTGVTAQGRWHEGENYHLFALRGFLLAAELARAADVDLYDRFPQLAGMYSAPLMTLLPDQTLPARGDSPFDVSIRQKRFAELWEIGYARTGDERLADTLSALYRTNGAAHDDINEIAELEQNHPPSHVSRRRLGWKALLWMRGDLPAMSGRVPAPQSVFVEPHGPIVLRPAADRYTALEGDGTGGGHGHPDRLQLTIWDGAQVQVDFGTGSYVSDSLPWYRSWLCHNGPVRRGTDGRGGSTVSVGWEVRAPWSWCQVTMTDFAGPGTTVVRSVILNDHYVIDVIDISVGSDVEVDLPIHPVYAINAHEFEQASSVAPWLDIGYDQVQWRAPNEPMGPVCLENGGELLLPERSGERIILASAPGPPGLTFGEGRPHIFPVRSCRGPGRWVQLFANRAGFVRRTTVNPRKLVVHCVPGSDTIRWQPGGIVIESSGNVFTLGGVRRVAVTPASRVLPERRRIECPLVAALPSGSALDTILKSQGFVMGRESYRRSETSYRGEDTFSARCCVLTSGNRVHFVVDVTKRELWMRPIDWPDPLLDNESPDIHSDSVQLYVSNPGYKSVPADGVADWRGYLIHPCKAYGHTPRIRPIRGTSAEADELTADVVMTDSGYRILASASCVPMQVGAQFLFNVVVNEMYAHRERRAGQLALSGGGWVYLRGDREDPAEAPVGVVV